MSLEWAQNFVGMRLSDEKMAHIPTPNTELTIHITHKTIEAFSVLGGCVLNPVYRLLRRKAANQAAVRAMARRFGVGGMFFGFAAGPLLTHQFISKKQLSKEEVQDRCFRLRYNQAQLTTDRAVTLAAPIGLLLGGLAGASFAINTATIGAGLYNNVIKPKMLGPPPAEKPYSTNPYKQEKPKDDAKSDEKKSI